MADEQTEAQTPKTMDWVKTWGKYKETFLSEETRGHDTEENDEGQKTRLEWCPLFSTEHGPYLMALRPAASDDPLLGTAHYEIQFGSPDRYADADGDKIFAYALFVNADGEATVECPATFDIVDLAMAACTFHAEHGRWPEPGREESGA